MIPAELKYAESHEWARLEKDSKQVTVGITDFAIEQLGDIVYLELPNIGDEVSKAESCGTIESVKAVSELNAPIAGKVVAVNEALTDNLELFKTDTYHGGWMIKIEPDAVAEFDSLMTATDYENYLKTKE